MIYTPKILVCNVLEQAETRYIEKNYQVIIITMASCGEVTVRS